MHKYKQILLLLILSVILVGLVIETMPKEDELEIQRDFNISTPEGNMSFENDREFIEFMEGWSE